MILTDLQMMTIAPFMDETIRNLKIMCGLKADFGDPFLDKVESFRFKGYAVAAPTRGKINGVILLHNYIETALTIGNRIRLTLLEENQPHDQITDDIQIALAEWANTIIGNATNDLAHRNLGIEFAPPYFITDTQNMNPLLENVRDIISIPIHLAEGGRFYFNYILYNECAAAYEAGQTGIATNGKILVVDDSQLMRAAMKKYLAKIGYENTVEASNGDEAIAMHTNENPDIIFLDHVMPQKTGYEALKQIRQTDRQVPVVMCTSVSDQIIINECRDLGISGYITKPLTAEDGPVKLKKILDNPQGG
ncbi:MAG: response regulator [Thermodesulfobacteriota bacterium]|nr:response regulator [Thermodesulfobacteriota bacterium]